VSTFSGLNTASTGLWAQQRALDVTGQNVANVNTPGYSRQRAELQSVAGSTVPAMFAVSNGIGQGVNADSVSRIRDAFLESRAQTEHAATASLTVGQATLGQIEDAFREPGATGLQQQLADMWAGWSDVMNNPTELGARSEVFQRSQTLAAGLNTTSATLDQQWSQNLDSLQTLVGDANASAGAIADLNQAIKRATQMGLPSNELADKRDALVLTLSDQIGATSSTNDDGTIDVQVGGATLVSGTHAMSLKVAGSNDPADSAAVATDPPHIETFPGGTTVRPGGTAEGQLIAMTTTIPGYKSQLDDIAAQLARDVNAVHQTGYDLDGNQGGPVFDGGPGSTAVTAGTIRVAITGERQLAAAKLAPADAGGAVSGDNQIADALYQLRLGTTGVDANYRKMIVGLGVEASTATNNLSTQSVISTQVDASRESVSGVSIDEEMSNMLQFQHAYSATARMITTIDETLDTLINHTGRVGL
jgi:flagellar hook-associated protein 1 FlgK